MRLLAAVSSTTPSRSGSGTRGRIVSESAAVIDFELTDEQRLIRDTAREFADNEIVPRARENDRNEHFDTDLVKKLGRHGLPRRRSCAEEYGGRGLDYRTYGADRRGGRPRRLVGAHRRVGADLARVLVDRSAGAPRSRSTSGSRGSAPARRSAASG